MIAINFIYAVKNIYLYIFLIFTCSPPSPSEQGCPPDQSTGPFPRKRSQSLQSKWKLLLFSWGVTPSAFLLWGEGDQTRQLCSVPLLSKMKKGGWWPNYLSHSSGLSLAECLISPSIQDTLINTVLGRFCLDFDNLAPMPFRYTYTFFFLNRLMSCSVAFTQSNAAFYTAPLQYASKSYSMIAQPWNQSPQIEVFLK